jgi:hypothetical protein
MTRDTPTSLKFPSRPPVADSPDVAFASLPLFRRLRDALTRAAGERRSPWGVPELFFFDDALQAEWEQRHGKHLPTPTPLGDLIDDALTVMAASVEARHAARAVDGLAGAAAAAASHDPKARTLAEVLAIPDDEVVRVVHPGARAGFRVLVRGLADVNQFHTLLADAVTGSLADGLLPGPRPHPRAVAAYRDQAPNPMAQVATARFQLYRPAALRPDGTLPAGFGGCDHWLFGTEPLAAIPREDGERVVLLGEPAVRTSWDVGRKFSWLVGELDVIEVMSAAQVADWVAARTGRAVRADAVRRAA